MNETEWNFRELNHVMKQFAQLMEGEFVQSLQRLQQLQNLIPHTSTPNMPIQPLNNNELQSIIPNVIPNIPIHQIQQMLQQMYTTEEPKEKKDNPHIPIQLWENDRHIYVLASMPGLRNGEEVKVNFLNDTHVRLKAKTSMNRPERNSRMTYSDFLQGYEREIELSQPVSTNTYSTQYSNGIYTLILNKLEEEIDIPIFEE